MHGNALIFSHSHRIHGNMLIRIKCIRDAKDAQIMFVNVRMCHVWSVNLLLVNVYKIQWYDFCIFRNTIFEKTHLHCREFASYWLTQNLKLNDTRMCEVLVKIFLLILWVLLSGLKMLRRLSSMAILNGTDCVGKSTDYRGISVLSADSIIVILIQKTYSKNQASQTSQWG